MDLENERAREGRKGRVSEWRGGGREKKGEERREGKNGTVKTGPYTRSRRAQVARPACSMSQALNLSTTIASKSTLRSVDSFIEVTTQMGNP